MNRRARLTHATRGMTASELHTVISELLDAAGLDRDERVELLGGALVSESVRPYWEAGMEAREAHVHLQTEDPELAEAVEAIAPMLFDRARCRQEAAELITLLERRLRC